jgi:hypothetical protein
VHGSCPPGLSTVRRRRQPHVGQPRHAESHEVSSEKKCKIQKRRSQKNPSGSRGPLGRRQPRQEHDPTMLLPGTNAQPDADEAGQQ